MKKQTSLPIFTLLILLFAATDGFAQQAENKLPDAAINAKVRAEVIENALKNLNASYVFPEVAKKIETDIKRRLQSKEYEKLTSARAFADKLTADLQTVSRDKHMRVRYSGEAIPVREKNDEPTDAEMQDYKRYLIRINYGFEKVERLPGNVGYIDLRGFTDAEAGAETVAAAMNFVSNTDALIFDLRQNGGGDPTMVALLCSYLFGDKPVHLNDLYYRKGNKTEEFWTKATVSGKKYGDKDVYVLTSSRTFSGAEEFSNNLKTLKRATIVGETTGGGANPGEVFRLNEHFGIFVPTGRAINPITKTNWEGVGVKPDVEVPKELALKTAHLLALNKSLERARDENLKNELKELIQKTQKEIDDLKKTAKSN